MFIENEDYKLLEWVLNYTNPDIVTLEYNGIATENDDTVIYSLEKQLNEIQNICNPTNEKIEKWGNMIWKNKH